MLIWTIVAIIPIALLGSALLASKGAARRRERTPDAWPGTEVEYKTRHDLIPDLKETLKVYSFPQGESFEPGAALSAPGQPSARWR
jgi:hypothetical protein